MASSAGRDCQEEKLLNDYPVLRQMIVEGCPVKDVIIDIQWNGDGSYTLVTYQDNLMTIAVEDRTKFLRWLMDIAQQCKKMGIDVYITRDNDSRVWKP